MNVPWACYKAGWTRSVRCCDISTDPLHGRWSRKWTEFRKSLMHSEQTMQILINENHLAIFAWVFFLCVGLKMEIFFETS